MVRRKIEVKRIENSTSRQVTFSKRKSGLLKKAYELQLLCDAEVALIIFSQKGRLYQFSSSNIQKIIQRYREYVKVNGNSCPDTDQQYGQHLKQGTLNMVEEIESLETSQGKLMGKNLGSCSIEELQSLDTQLESSLRNIRVTKAQLLQQEIDQLKAKGKHLLEENARLHVKFWEKQCPAIAIKERVIGSQSSESSEVDTKLFIGLPEN